MKIKSILSAALAAVMIFNPIASGRANAAYISAPAAQVQSVGAVVDSGTCGDNLTWTLDDEGTLTISGEGKMSNWTYPFLIPWYNDHKYDIKKIIINNGVTSIGSNAFLDCVHLTSITIPDSVTSIGDKAFNSCSSLESITLPDSFASIGVDVFSGCFKLTSINVDNNNKYYSEINGVLFNKDKTEIICHPAGKEYKEYVIPDSVSRIADYAFIHCLHLTSITIPDSVTSIGDDAFYNCAILASVTIGDSVTSIGERAFDGCYRLTSITIPDSVTSIGSFAFEGTPWLGAKQKENPLVIVNGLLIDGTKCEGDVVIPDSVTSICDLAFWNCSSITSITIPDSVTSIGKSVFASCSSFTSITILNPNCEICDEKDTICNDNYSGVIRGYSGSTAQAYAEKYGRTFESIGDAPVTTTTTTTNTTTTTTTTTTKPTTSTTTTTTTTTTSTTTTKPTTTTSTTTATTTSKTTTTTSTTTTRTTAKNTATITLPQTTTTTNANDIIIHIGETKAVPGITVAASDKFSVDGDNITGIKPYEQIVMVGDQYKTLKIVPPELRLFTYNREIAPGAAIVYSEGMTIRAQLSNFYPDLENKATWNIAEPRDVNGVTKYSTTNWRGLYDDVSHIVNYDESAHTAVIEFTLNTAPENDLNGVLYWHIANGNDIYFSDNSFTLSLTAPEVVFGDANGDGEIKLNDAVLIMQALSNPNKFGIDGTDELHITSDGWANADCNNPGDGVTGKDALAIQKFMLSLIDSLPEK